MITQKELRRIFDYLPTNGSLLWKEKISDKVVVGSTAGTKNDSGYIIISINKKRYRAHRLVWLYSYGEWPSEVDHINHVCDDNRLENLRSVSHSCNGKNCKKNKRNKSGVTGVHWDKARDKWAVEIFVNGTKHHLGRYDSKFDAACIRKSAERRHNFHFNHGAQ